MKLTIFDGEDEVTMTRQEISELDGEKVAALYFTNEVYRSELKKKVKVGESEFDPLLEEVSSSADALLTNLIARFGKDEALNFAAGVSLTIILEEDESND